jgi:hypothetical protein
MTEPTQTPEYDPPAVVDLDEAQPSSVVAILSTT